MGGLRGEVKCYKLWEGGWDDPIKIWGAAIDLLKPYKERVQNTCVGGGVASCIKAPLVETCSCCLCIAARLTSSAEGEALVTLGTSIVACSARRHLCRSFPVSLSEAQESLPYSVTLWG